VLALLQRRLFPTPHPQPPLYFGMPATYCCLPLFALLTPFKQGA